MKEISFIISEDRAKYLEEDLFLCACKVEPHKDNYVLVTISYDERNENIAIQSIFHAGVICGVNECLKRIN